MLDAPGMLKTPQRAEEECPSNKALTLLASVNRTPSLRRILRFTLVSAVCVPASFAVIFLVYGVLRLWTEVPSTLFAFVITGIPSYYLNRRWVWGRSGRSHLTREVIPFWIVSLVALAASLVSAAEARRLGISHHLSHGIRTLLLLATLVATSGVLWVAKYILFHLMFRTVDEPFLAEADAL